MLDLGIEVHPCEDVLHVVRKAVEVSLEVVHDVFGIRDKGLKSERAGVVELVSGCLTQEPILYCELLHFLICIEDRLMCRQQAVVKTLDDRHGQDDKAVLMRFVCPHQVVGDRPDECRCVVGVFTYGFIVFITRCWFAWKPVIFKIVIYRSMRLHQLFVLL